MFRKLSNDEARPATTGDDDVAVVRLHRSEDGLLSFSASIAMLCFALLATLVLNVGQSVRHKIAIQNSADASAQSAAACMARGMNAVTASNHLLGELTALCVMHEALGGPELDDGTTLPSVKSLELNQKLITILPAATVAVAPYAALGQFDAMAVQLLVKDLGTHSSWATIYDSRLTLKYHLSIALTMRPVATALNIIPGAGPTLALSLHIAIAAVVTKIYIETQILDMIDIIAQGFSPAKLGIEATVLPMLASYAESAVEQTPRAAVQVVKDVGRRNGVTTFLFPEEPKLPLVQQEIGGGLGIGGSEPPAGDATGGPVDGAFSALQKARDTINDFVETVKDAVSWNPLLSAIADKVLDITVPSLAQPDGPGDDGFEDNLSRKKLPRLSTAGWNEIRYSQWMRATYPYIRAWRLPVRESLAGLQTLSFASKWYSRWTNRYALVKIRKFHQGDYGGGGGKELKMFVMTDMKSESKGRESWTTDGAAAEKMFTLVVFAHRKPPAPIGSAIFGSGPADGITTYAQSIYYNGNDQRPQGWTKGSAFQPTVGWDTLNWQSPAPAARAFEFIHGDDSDGVSLIPPMFPFIFLDDPPGDDPIVALNWQAKLTPVTRLDESWSQTPADIRAPLQKMHENHGSFRTH